MDDADRSDSRIQQMIDDGIARVRSKRSLQPIIQFEEGTNKRIGICHYCQSEIPAGRLFCPDDECSKDYEHELERRAATGL